MTVPGGKAMGTTSIKPKHLEKIYVPTDANGLEGEIICTCGCRAFKIRYFGEFYEELKLSVQECGDKFGHAVKAVCADCGTEHLLYDFALHGFDGRIGNQGIVVSDEMLADFRTSTDDLFEIKMVLEYDDEQTFFEDFVTPEGIQKDYHFTMLDRADIWSWVVIELKGVRSGHIYQNFVNEELA